MTIDREKLDALDPNAKRELLARLLRDRAAGVGETIELSLGQEALYFLNQLSPQSASYNVAFCARIRAKVDTDRLGAAFLKLLERHTSLRCTFPPSDEERRQRVGRVPSRCLEVLDASTWSAQELKAQVNQSYRRPFDLAIGPLFRASLFTCNDADHILLITAHHIVFDASSLGIVLADLALLYDHGSTAPLPALTGSYANFVKWQRKTVDSDEGRKAWEVWRSRLAEFLTPIDVPGDRARPDVQSFRGATHHFELPPGLCHELRSMARTENATPFMVLATAFHALMCRYSGSSHVPIAMPLSGRSRPEFENIVGYFVNPVVLCAPIGPEATFRQHLASMRETIIRAQLYGDFPFPELVKRLQPRRDTSRAPLCQVMLNLIKAAQIGATGAATDAEHRIQMQLGTLPMETFPLDQQEGQFDLDLDLLDMGAGMVASLKYSTDLFDSDRIERMAGHFVTLLSAAIADPDLKISGLPMLTDIEREQILVKWNATERDYSAGNITRAIEEQVRRTPQATAIVFENREISFHELNLRANQLARHLRSLGVGPDTLIAVCQERSIEMVLGLLGVLKAGGAYVPIDPADPLKRRTYMLQDSGARVLLTQAKLAESVGTVAPRTILLDSEWEVISRYSGDDFENEAGPEHLAYVIYASDSTGKPKGIQIPRRGLTNLLWSMREWLKLTEHDRLLALATTSLDIASVDIWLPLLTGAQMVLASRETASVGMALRNLIEQLDITFLQAPPSTWRLLFEAGWRGKPSFQAATTGEAVPADIAAQLVQAAGSVWHLYGPTETTIWSTGYELREVTGQLLIGRPIANTRCYILDAQGEPVPAGVTGELCIAGEGLARGYLNQPKLTAEKFVANSFRGGRERMYRTGDLTRYRNSGEIEWLGRLDQQVSIRGRRIEPGEIEAVLSQHADVAQAVAIAHEHAPGDSQLVAYLVPRARATLDVSELREFLRSSLPEYMVPSAFVILEAVPLDSSGKVNRKALPRPESVLPAQAATKEHSGTECESALAETWFI